MGRQLGGELLVGNLDGDNAIQARVAGLVDFSHAARAKGRGDLVRAQPGSGSQSHKVNDCTARDMGREWMTGYSSTIRLGKSSRQTGSYLAPR
jgi:hypothetical protein